MRFFIVCIFLLGIACSNNKGNIKIIPKKDFVNLLVDIHIFDAYVTDHSIGSYIDGIDSTTLYQSIFEKYNANIDMFQSTMDYYSERPEKFGEIYDEVFGNITKLNQDLTDQMDMFNQGNLQELSNFQKYIIVRGDSTELPKPFIYNLQGPGTYLLSTQVRLLKDDQSKNPILYACFLKDSININSEDKIVAVEFPLQKSNFSRDYQFILELKDKEYNFFYIKIPKVDNTDFRYNKNLQISTLKLNYIPHKKAENADTTLKAN